MGINIPTVRIEFLDPIDANERRRRDLAIKQNLYELKFKDEAGQTNDVLTLSILDDGTFNTLPAKSKIGLSIGYIIPASSNKPKDTEFVSNTLSNADKIKDFIANQARGVVASTVGKYVPNFLVSSTSGTFTGQKPSNDTTKQADDREAIFYSLGTFAVNKMTKHKTATEKTIDIECLTISTRTNMQTTKTRNFNGKTLQEVALTIATETGLTLSIHSDVADAPIQIAQTGISNQSFLRGLCEKHNASFKVIGDVMFINHRDATTTVGNKPLPEIVLDDATDIITWDLIVDTVNKTITGVRALYWSENGEEKIAITAGNSTGTVIPLHTVFQNAETAQREANAYLNKGVSSKDGFTFSTDGTKLLVPDSKFRVTSDDTLLNNRRFKVTSANYSFTAGNLRVSYNCERA